MTGLRAGLSEVETGASLKPEESNSTAKAWFSQSQAVQSTHVHNLYKRVHAQQACTLLSSSLQYPSTTSILSSAQLLPPPLP